MSLDNELGGDAAKQKRAARFLDQQQGPPKKQRKQQFNQPAPKPFNISKTINNPFTVDSGEDIDWSSMHIVGTCTTLEKKYLRLTSVSGASSYYLLMYVVNCLS